MSVTGYLEEYLPPSFLLQNFGLGMQQEFMPGSLFGILPEEAAISREISSSAISRPFTLVSKERIPFWELPINF
jgi:hypothetical protein